MGKMNMFILESNRLKLRPFELSDSRRVQEFDELGLNKIWAAAFTSNPASSKVMKKLGMKYEGTFPQHILKWDNYEDLEFYGLLTADYVMHNK